VPLLLEIRWRFAYIGRLKQKNGAWHEKDVSAPQEKAKEHAWLSSQNGHEKRPKSAEPKTRAGSQTLNRQRIGKDPLVATLPKDRILRGRGAFADVLANGTPVSAGSVKLFFAPSDPPSPLRTGFTVTRSARNAAVRNRVKRCLREAFRLSRHDLRSGRMVLLYAGKTPGRSSEVDCTKIQRDVQAALDRISRKEQ